MEDGPNFCGLLRISEHPNLTKYILVMYGRVIYFFARQIEIGLYVGNDYELWCSIALHWVRFYKHSGITN